MRRAWPPVELGEARAKLSAAEKAVAEKEMVAGAQLADEARADAELAAARTGAAKAKAVNADIKRSTATLEEEMQRKTGDSQMNSTAYSPFRSLIAAAVAATLFAGCASVPKHPAGSEQVRAKLTALQAEPTLANRAPVAIKDAEGAVVLAEMTEKDLVLAAHRVYIADRKVETARALAETSIPNRNAPR